MNTQNQNIEIASLKNTIEDLLISQEQMKGQHAQEMNRLNQKLTEQQETIQSLQKQVSLKQRLYEQLTITLQAALHQAILGESND